MFETVKCNLCGSGSYRILYSSALNAKGILCPEDFACSNLGHGDYHRIVSCNICGLVYCNPRDPADLIEDFYSKVKDNKYLEFSDGRTVTFQKALKHVEKLKSGKNLLDIGCYTGLFMKAAILKGWNAVGIEPSSWACENGKKDYGLNIINSSIYKAGEIKDKFDLITLWDVIEHLTDPKAVLKICRDKLRDDGILAISTMRCQGIFYRLCGRRWKWYMRMHLYYFTVKTITEMLKDSGFKVIRIRPYTHYVSLNYLFYKLMPSDNRLSVFFNNPVLKRIIVPVQLGDFMEVYASKS